MPAGQHQPLARLEGARLALIALDGLKRLFPRSILCPQEAGIRGGG
jgi:hypothetical protein